MPILYNKQGIAVEVPDGAVQQALKEGFTENPIPLVVLLKNYDPNVEQDEVPVEIQGSPKQIEISLFNKTSTSLNIKYGDFGSEAIIPGGVPGNSRLRLIVFSGETQIAELPTVMLTADVKEFAETGENITILATQVNSGIISKIVYYINDVVAGESTVPPYSFIRSFSSTGRVKIYARVYNSTGLEFTTTNTIEISIKATTRRTIQNKLPLIYLTAPDTGLVNQAITLNFLSFNLKNAISKVEFFANNIKISEDTTIPYTATFTPTVEGVFLFKAKVTDVLNNSLESDVFTFRAFTPVVGQGSTGGNGSSNQIEKFLLLGVF